MILSESFPGGADFVFLQKYAGIPHPIQRRGEARRAQEFWKANSSLDIPTYATTNRLKSQIALLAREYYYFFI